MGPLPAAQGCDCHVCRPDESSDAQDQRTIDTVLEHGWQIMLVSDQVTCSDPAHHDHEGHSHEEAGPAFAYTVGLGHRADHPELLMSGLNAGLMHRALSGVSRRVMDGLRLEPGDIVEGVLGGVPVVVEQVADTALRETVTWSGWFHRRKPKGLVLVWPSTGGLFAWQPGAPEVLDQLQPPQWRAPWQHDGALAADPEWLFPVAPDRLAFTCTHVLEDGEVILWAARESEDQRGEDWSAHCGAPGHETADMRVVHLAHLVRASPSLRTLHDLELDQQADRDTADGTWRRSHLGAS